MGVLVYDPEQIAEIFGEFYQSLYSTVADSQLPNLTTLPQHICDYLAKCSMPTLKTSDVLQLNFPITVEELWEVIKTLPLHKSPGPGGLPYFYHKTFSATLIPCMHTLFNAFLADALIPPNMSHSHIKVFPKPGKDPQDAFSYCPMLF